MHVNQGVLQIFMTEQNLNGAEIRSSLIEMRRETMAQSVGMDAFLEAGVLGGFMTCVPNGFHIDGPILAIVAGEQATNAPLPHAKRPPPGGYVQTGKPEVMPKASKPAGGDL